MATENIEKPEILNKHFATVGQQLANEMNLNLNRNQNLQITYYTPAFTQTVPTIPTFSKILINDAFMNEQITKLKSNKAIGPDGVSPKIVKIAGLAIVPSLANIF